MESHSIESFYQSTWVVELQQHHQQLFMEEIKAQIVFKPVDRFSIMSAFEEADDDANFPARKKPGSRRPYRTLDEELQVYFSNNDTPISKESGRSNEPNCSSAESPVGEFHGQRNSDRSAHERSVASAERRAVQDSMKRLKQSAAKPASPRSRPEPTGDHVPMDFQETRKVGKDKPHFTTGGGDQGDIPVQQEPKESTDTAQLVEEHSYSTPILQEESTTITDSEHPEAAGLNECESVAALSVPATAKCHCDVPKVDKACQAQPQLATVGTMYGDA